MIPRAFIDGYELPLSFKYDPYLPAIRRSSTRTATMVIHQAPADPTLTGDVFLNWSLNPAYPHEWRRLRNIHTAAQSVTFTGYWGDEYEVYWTMDIKPVKNRLFQGTGQMQVICVTTNPNPTCSAFG